MTTIDFTKIRTAPSGPRDAFEDLACLLFKTSASVPQNSSFTRIRGSGGDGGVEAYFTDETGNKYGVQAKYFFKLGNSELNQIKDSFKTALLNHPSLIEYHIYIPFDLTGEVAGGKRGVSESEKFLKWKADAEESSRKLGHATGIKLVTAADISRNILELDSSGGLRRYWFDNAAIPLTTVQHALALSEAIAGPRFTSALDVSTEAHEMLDLFGGIGSMESWLQKNFVPPTREFVREISTSRIEKIYQCLGADKDRAFLEELERIADLLEELYAQPEKTSAISELIDRITSALPVLEQAEDFHYKEFCSKHGEKSDTINFRQFRAEYMADFPAGMLDSVRDTAKVLEKLRDLIQNPIFRVRAASTLLMVGPAGIGKTHSLVSAAKRRLEHSALSVVLFGDEFDGSPSWQVIANRLGFSGGIGRDELYGCMQAAAERTGAPFLLVIDALNESPNLNRWKAQLRGLIAELKPYPAIKLVISTRDTFKSFVVDEEFPGYAFTNNGFAGRELIAMQAFCQYHGLSAEITPLFADELTNPLFLQLACKTIKENGGNQLDVSLPGFIQLVESYFKVCDSELRAKLGYANPANLVRAALLAIVQSCHDSKKSSLSWTLANSAIRPIVDGEVQSQTFLQGLRTLGLIIIAPDPKSEDEESYLIRIGFQRYSDVLLSMAIAAGADEHGSLNEVRLQKALADFGEGDLGVIEALSCVLPEKFGVELAEIKTTFSDIQLYTAFLNSVPWRSRNSIRYDTERLILKALQAGLWKLVYATLFKVSLVPMHRLNAYYLRRLFGRQSLVQRDPYLSLFLRENFDEKGVVESIIQCAFTADTTRWPPQSVYLLGEVLAWQCSASDRRVRDRSTKAMTELFSKHPQIIATILEKMENCEDEYILESLVLSTYCGQLLSKETTPYYDALEVLLKSSAYDTPNIIIRDAVIMLAKNTDADSHPKFASILSRYPRKASLPAKWPTLEDVDEFLQYDGVPGNLKMRPTGMYTDFSQYVIRGAVEAFDIKKRGITYENILAWFMQGLMQMGYASEETNLIPHDYKILKKYGSGRAKPVFAETLGKKYYWIALHRLVGLLSDNVDLAKDYDGSIKYIEYRSQNYRKLDPTDLRQQIPAPVYPMELVSHVRYPFTLQPEDDGEWVSSLDEISSAESCFFRKDKEGNTWVCLRIHVDDSERSDEIRSEGNYRNISLSHRALLIPSEQDFRVAERSRNIDSPFETQSDGDYKIFAAEYPDSEMMRSRLKDETFYTSYETEIAVFNFSVLTILRGGNWEYDASNDVEPESLDVPAPSIVSKLDLRWDGNSGWRTCDERLGAVYLQSQRISAFLIRQDELDSYLARTDQALLIRRYVWKYRVTNSHGGAQSDRFSYLRYAHGRLEVLNEVSQIYLDDE